MISENKPTYTSVTDEIKNLNIPNNKKVLAFVASLVMSLLIVSGPIAVFINLMIYNDMQKMFAFLIATMIIVLIFLLDLFYLKGITEGKVRSLKTIVLTDTFILGLVVYALLLVMFYLEVF